MLFISKVPRSLDAKTRLFGFELADLLLIFIYLSLSNLIFGNTPLKFPMVWLGTLLIAGVLFFVKRNKPDHYLEHWGEFHRSSGILSAGAADIEYQPYLAQEVTIQKSTADGGKNETSQNQLPL